MVIENRGCLLTISRECSSSPRSARGPSDPFEIFSYSNLWKISRPWAAGEDGSSFARAPRQSWLCEIRRGASCLRRLPINSILLPDQTGRRLPPVARLICSTFPGPQLGPFWSACTRPQKVLTVGQDLVGLGNLLELLLGHLLVLFLCVLVRVPFQRQLTIPATDCFRSLSPPELGRPCVYICPPLTPRACSIFDTPHEREISTPLPLPAPDYSNVKTSSPILSSGEEHANGGQQLMDTGVSNVMRRRQTEPRGFTYAEGG